MNLTNVSNRQTRQKLVETYLGLLTENVKTLHIQMMNQDNQWLRLLVSNTTQLLQYILLPLNKMPPEANLGMETTPPWKETISEFWENIRPPHSNPTMNPPTHTTTAIQTEPPTPSSSDTAKKNSNNSKPDQQPQKKRRHSQQSTTETTSTSSLPPEQTTSPEQLIESYTFFLEPIRELQRRIALYNRSTLQQDSLPTYCVSVFQSSYRLEFDGVDSNNA
ncbi:hypothetical protein PR048_004597 [Dryococelus australis]|uniref:Uncharacterized protein n=1 Tax=Dryococelus australis TaxID=614101 RepID=A0ABQ9I5V2_9NEOP|nr:hypothetical protein PR048_004597 [Dryococelus australis]